MKKAKRALTIILLTVLLLFTACSEQEDENPYNKKDPSGESDFVDDRFDDDKDSPETPDDPDVQTINITNFINPNFEYQFNGYAEPELDVDYEKLDKFIDSTKVAEYIQNLILYNNYDSDDNSYLSDIIHDGAKFYDFFDIGFDEKYQNLKSGEKFYVTISVDYWFEKITGASVKEITQNLGIRFTNDKFEFTVPNLETPKYVIDVFEDIEKYITYTGSNGNGSIGYDPINIPYDYFKQFGEVYLSKNNDNPMYDDIIKVIYNNKKVGEICFAAYSENGESTPFNVSKGDIVTICITTPRDDESYQILFETLASIGCVFESTEYTITVPDLGEHFKTKEQLTPDVIASIKSFICESEEIDAIDKLYFAKYKPGIECEHYTTAFIVAVYDYGGWLSTYRTHAFYDIIIKPDGSIYAEYDAVWDYYDYINEVIEDLDYNSYNFVELD